MKRVLMGLNIDVHKDYFVVSLGLLFIVLSATLKMGNKKLQLLGQRYEDDCSTAEISFKAGMKKVVDWIERNCDLENCDPTTVTAEWQAKLKEWGLDTKKGWRLNNESRRYGDT